MNNVTTAWKLTLQKILGEGALVSPRGQLTRELQHHTFSCDMTDPVVRSPERALSYKFLAAEALWILAGDETVAGIAPYNQHIAQFSDDGKTFFGAYGPRVVAQLDYVVKALVDDPGTRQAVLTTWRTNPPKTRDVPCTVALAFVLRNGLIHCHVFMRSSDAWLGLPYDAFNFSMIAAKVACMYNARTASGVRLGALYLTAASSHLYERNFDSAVRCFIEPNSQVSLGTALQDLVSQGDWQSIDDSLVACRDNHARQWAKPWVIRPTVMP